MDQQCSRLRRINGLCYCRRRGGAVCAQDGMLAQKAHDVLELTPWTISLGRPHCSPGPSQTLQSPDGAATPSHSRAWPCRGPSQAGRHCPHQVPSPGANKLLNAAAHCSTPNPHSRCKSPVPASLLKYLDAAMFPEPRCCRTESITLDAPLVTCSFCSRCSYEV